MIPCFSPLLFIVKILLQSIEFLLQHVKFLNSLVSYPHNKTIRSTYRNRVGRPSSHSLAEQTLYQTQGKGSSISILLVREFAFRGFTGAANCCMVVFKWRYGMIAHTYSSLMLHNAVSGHLVATIIITHQNNIP